MEATELRIGNYVEHQIHKIGTVQSLGDTTILISTNYDEIELIDIKPIPLTEDWLLKFGFGHEEQAPGRLKLDCEFGIVLIPFNPCKAECQHVHQLQNLYKALTGEELTIKTIVYNNI